MEDKILDLKKVEEKISELIEKKDKIRDDIFREMESKDLKQYKNDVATLSYTVRKTLKYDMDKMVSILEEMELLKYYKVQKVTTKDFEKDVKDGNFMLDGIEVIEKALPQIRFAK